MAGKGGYQEPSEAQGPGGVGKNSRRSDKTQPNRTPPLSDPRVQSGDVGKMQQAQRAIPLKDARGQTASAIPSRGPSANPQANRLPPFVLDMESQRPGEPVTAGLDIGPGDGSESLRTMPPPDTRSQILSFLSSIGNAKARELLMTRDAPPMQGFTPPVRTPQPAEEQYGDIDDLEPIDLDAEGGE